MDILTGILIPFVGTTAGSACVFFLRGELKPGVQKAFLGFYGFRSYGGCFCLVSSDPGYGNE